MSFDGARNHTHVHEGVSASDAIDVLKNPTQAAAKVHLFVDTSGSMCAASRGAFVKAVVKKMSEDEETVNIQSVHVFSDNHHPVYKRSHELVDQERDEFLKGNIKFDGAERMWEYLYEVATGKLLETGDHAHEILIITDGQDTRSQGAFHGIEGYKAVLEGLEKNFPHERLVIRVLIPYLMLFIVSN